MGVIGRLSTTQNDAKYTLADFFFNFVGNISLSGADVLCFHPIFSRFLNSYRHRDGDKRIIYPVGVRVEF
jgi:hypothetical protein